MLSRTAFHWNQRLHGGPHTYYRSVITSLPRLGLNTGFGLTNTVLRYLRMWREQNKLTSLTRTTFGGMRSWRRWRTFNQLLNNGRERPLRLMQLIKRSHATWYLMSRCLTQMVFLEERLGMLMTSYYRNSSSPHLRICRITRFGKYCTTTCCFEWAICPCM